MLLQQQVQQPAPITIKDHSFAVQIIRTKNRYARATVSNNAVIIKIPYRYSQKDAQSAITNLYGRMARMIQKRLDHFIGKNLSYISFAHNDAFTLFGHAFTIQLSYTSSNSARAYLKDDIISIFIPEHLSPQNQTMVSSRLARKVITREVIPEIEKRVGQINSVYFQSSISNVNIRAGTSRWGSYSSKTRNIALNFKLLFLPEQYLNYVIAHELAHTKQHNHSPKFWALVSQAIPDYKQIRRQLATNGVHPAAIERKAYTQLPVSQINHINGL